MICAHCARGADLAATLEEFPFSRAKLYANQRSGRIRRVNNHHGRCRGCTCQHRGTPHAKVYAPGRRQSRSGRWVTVRSADPPYSAQIYEPKVP